MRANVRRVLECRAHRITDRARLRCRGRALEARVKGPLVAPQKEALARRVGGRRHRRKGDTRREADSDEIVVARRDGGRRHRREGDTLGGDLDEIVVDC